MTNLHNMNSEKIRINETHICVLRKKENQDELYVDFFELKFPYQTQLEELKILSENPNRSVLELVDFVKNSNLSVLMKSFDFCESLSSPWQYCPNISEIKSEDYRKCISEYNQKIKEAKDENEREIENNRKQNFINSKRTNFYAKIEKHVLPYLLECTYNKLEGNKSVLAFSHRRIGWSKPEFRLSNELSVIYKTNFGYGASSYFFTNIKYKGIDILPYSDWIRYYHANKAEIIRYTRRHLLKNEEWIKTMDFTAEMYNSSIMEPDVFIENWIINEVDEMVKGLERLLNRNDKYEIINSYFHKDTHFTLMGRNLVRFKGEKIAGALYFMDKLKELKPLYADIELYIERIMQCNMSIYPQLKNEINLINNEHIVHPFPPLYDDNSRILILGSLPSVKSREQMFFYGHKQNRFWKVMANILHNTPEDMQDENKHITEENAVSGRNNMSDIYVPVTIEEKKKMLHRHHIALWDAIYSCDIIGSSDI